MSRPPLWMPPTIGATLAFLAAVLVTLTSGYSAAELARTGVRVDGVLSGVQRNGRNADTASVRYTAGGVERVGTLVLPDDRFRDYAAGGRVTVIYDPDDPDRFRTDEFANEPAWAKGFASSAMFVTAGLVIMAIYGFMRGSSSPPGRSPGGGGRRG